MRDGGTDRFGVSTYYDYDGGVHRSIKECIEADEKIKKERHQRALEREEKKGRDIQSYGKLGRHLIKLGLFFLLPGAVALAMQGDKGFHMSGTIFGVLATVTGFTLMYVGITKAEKWRALDERYDRFIMATCRIIIKTLLSAVAIWVACLYVLTTWKTDIKAFLNAFLEFWQ